MSDVPDLCGGAGRATGRFRFAVLDAEKSRHRTLIALAATYRTRQVGCILELGTATSRMARIEPSGTTLTIHRAALIATGADSDRLIVALSDAWALPLPSPVFRPRVVLEHVVLTAAALQMPPGPPRIALFAPGPEQASYFEILVQLDAAKSTVEWLEKTPRFRSAFLKRLAAPPSAPN
jgi:hypothetical protein